MVNLKPVDITAAILAKTRRLQIKSPVKVVAPFITEDLNDLLRSAKSYSEVAYIAEKCLPVTFGNTLKKDKKKILQVYNTIISETILIPSIGEMLDLIYNEYGIYISAAVESNYIDRKFHYTVEYTDYNYKIRFQHTDQCPISGYNKCFTKILTLI